MNITHNMNKNIVFFMIYIPFRLILPSVRRRGYIGKRLAADGLPGFPRGVFFFLTVAEQFVICLSIPIRFKSRISFTKCNVYNLLTYFREGVSFLFHIIQPCPGDVKVMNGDGGGGTKF